MPNQITMKNQGYCFGLVAVLVAVYICVKLMFRRELCIEVNYPPPLYLRYVDNESEMASSAEEQRDALSRQLNSLKQAMGKLECEVRDDKTSDTGGWCRQASTEGGGQHITDMSMAKALSGFFKDKRVASFGDGPGAYKRELLKLGEVKQYDAYDGAPYGEETSGGLVQFLDLTVPAFGLPSYDWIVSLEVAEHIPEKFEPVYLDNIRRHCTEGVVLSWATPDQGGLAHINQRPLTYVVNTMENLGFTYDNKSSTVFQQAAELDWLRANTHVFRKKSPLKKSNK